MFWLCCVVKYVSDGALRVVVIDGVLFFFFFQAEDGIRDHCVTGVQTCALPISISASSFAEASFACKRLSSSFCAFAALSALSSN